jgi:hypothetical protein
MSFGINVVVARHDPNFVLLITMAKGDLISQAGDNAQDALIASINQLNQEYPLGVIFCPPQPETSASQLLPS